jgi:predicted TIM-barrel fold metal-dependent hydrolase
MTMTQTDVRPVETDHLLSGQSPVVIVSSDTHISPLLSDMRAYCPSQYLDDYDSFMNRKTDMDYQNLENETEGRVRRQELNLRTSGHHDVAARRADMDEDGVAAEIIFHGSTNDQAFPLGLGGFGFGTFFGDIPTEHLELVAAGIRIYNRYIIDVTSDNRARHVPLAYVPFWDVDLCVEEAKWAGEAGFKGINFPANRPGIPQYDDPFWEPFWAACASSGLVLNTHCGAAAPGHLDGTGRHNYPHTQAIIPIESATWAPRRNAIRMIYGGVFDRHPNLRLALTEQPGVWWRTLANDLDSVWLTSASESLHRQVPSRPSDYMSNHLFVGASFLAPFEVADAMAEGYSSNVMWGSDYPHSEGTWASREEIDEPNRTTYAIRDAFHSAPELEIRKMIGENAVRLFDLDLEELQQVANRIKAPTIRDIKAPITPEDEKVIAGFQDRDRDYTKAFRRYGLWG